MSRLLIVEDDRGVRESLARALQYEGYEVATAADGREAMKMVRQGGLDAMVLDVMMPELDGLEVARKLRLEGQRIPILMLTARHEISDRVAGLEAGADDYLVKPFALDELLARLMALLRRGSIAGVESRLRLSDLELDPASRLVWRSGVEIELTKTEFDLLELLLANAGIVLGRDLIYERIWGYDFETSSNPLEVYVGYLRRKLEQNGGSRLIHTVRGVGYVARER